jgi:hypothetical protein
MLGLNAWEEIGSLSETVETDGRVASRKNDKPLRRRLTSARGLKRTPVRLASQKAKSPGSLANVLGFVLPRFAKDGLNVPVFGIFSVERKEFPVPAN